MSTERTEHVQTSNVAMETFKQELFAFQSVTKLHSETELNNEHMLFTYLNI